MIKRTGEKVLSWIGNILHLLYLGFIVLMVSMMGNKDFKDEMINSSQSSNQTYHLINLTNIMVCYQVWEQVLLYFNCIIDSCNYRYDFN